ncbi:MAG: AAA family ATPase [Desulfobacterales bacterium]|nr:AAA family ATPase [Desulfobacterales bacterium]
MILIGQYRKVYFTKNVDRNSRLLGIVGARGTGKTTLLLQHLAEQDKRHERHLYVSADHIRVQATGLYEIASYFFRLGGETIMKVRLRVLIMLLW